ncbi:hypothetical protein Lsed01_01189 [Demequina sediminis]|uniref:Peptidase M10 metallopeptidase domain-containing protein n=1 Tax=Demequina sediminis TaxID=1930058 RepID=A0ABP9WI54_9MICO|nr:matrixin family metalloprotease [Demequina sediminis]
MKSLARILGIAAVAAMLLAAGAWWRGVTWSDVEHWGTPRNVIDAEGVTVRIPVASGPAERILPQVAPTTTGEHAFLFPSGGEGGGPVRYDPCRPLAYVLSPSLMPEGFEPLIHEAVAQVSAATGLSFAYEGRTDEPVSFDRAPIQERYGERFAPIVVGFQNEGQNPDLAGTVTGLGGSSAVPGAYGDARFLRAGVVVLDDEDMQRLLSEPGGTDLARAVVAHELAHVVGLAHVVDTSELMHESNLRLTDWGPGDLEGLALAGAGGCERT